MYELFVFQWLEVEPIINDHETEDVLKIRLSVKTMKGYLDSRHKRIVRRFFVNTWH